MEYKNKDINTSTRIYNAVLKLYSLIDLNIQEEVELKKHSKLLVSLCYFIFSKFRYKLTQFELTTDLIYLINKFLQFCNSKFLLSEELAKDEFITITLYFFHEFDIVLEFVEFLNNYEKKEMTVSLKNLVSTISPSNNCNDFTSASTSALEGYSKLSFIKKSIKKQTNLLINLIYKLNQIKTNQQRPVNSMKIEEILLLSSNSFFNTFYNEFSISNEILNRYLENISKMIDLLDTLYEEYKKNYNNYSLSERVFNKTHDMSNKKNKIVFTQNAFFIIMIGKANSNIIEKLNKFTNALEDKLSGKLSSIKETNNLINEPHVIQTLNKIASELENFIQANEKNIPTILSQFDDSVDNLVNEKKIIEYVKSNEKLETLYENFLFVQKGVDQIFQTYKREIDNLIKQDTNIIKKNYCIYNNTK